MWVAVSSTNKVVKLRLKDGALLGSFNVGSVPYGVVFDGANIWVVNFASSNVTKLAANGSILGTFNVGQGPEDAAFDGANVWVVNVDDGTASKL